MFPLKQWTKYEHTKCTDDVMSNKTTIDHIVNTYYNCLLTGWERMIHSICAYTTIEAFGAMTDTGNISIYIHILDINTT